MKKCGRTAENTEFYRRIDARTGEEYYVPREFVTMSRRPGIGSGFYDRFKSDIFPSDRCVLDGKLVSVPKYYLNKLEKEDPSLFLSLKAKRRESAVKQCIPDTGSKRSLRATLQRMPRYLARAASLGVAVEGSESSPARLSSRLVVDESRLETFSKREL